MNNKELLYKKLNALRLEVHGSIVDDIKSTVDAIFQEQNLQQCNVSGALPLNPKIIEAAKAEAEILYPSNEIERIAYEQGYIDGAVWMRTEAEQQ